MSGVRQSQTTRVQRDLWKFHNAEGRGAPRPAGGAIRRGRRSEAKKTGGTQEPRRAGSAETFSDFYREHMPHLLPPKMQHDKIRQIGGETRTKRHGQNCVHCAYFTNVRFFSTNSRWTFPGLADIVEGKTANGVHAAPLFQKVKEEFLPGKE